MRLQVASHQETFMNNPEQDATLALLQFSNLSEQAKQAQTKKTSRNAEGKDGDAAAHKQQASTDQNSSQDGRNGDDSHDDADSRSSGDRKPTNGGSNGSNGSHSSLHPKRKTASKQQDPQESTTDNGEDDSNNEHAATIERPHGGPPLHMTNGINTEATIRAMQLARGNDIPVLPAVAAAAPGQDNHRAAHLMHMEALYNREIQQRAATEMYMQLERERLRQQQQQQHQQQQLQFLTQYRSAQGGFQIGRKRKNHPVVESQFDDAPEPPLLLPPPTMPPGPLPLQSQYGLSNYHIHNAAMRSAPQSAYVFNHPPSSSMLASSQAAQNLQIQQHLENQRRQMQLETLLRGKLDVGHPGQNHLAAAQMQQLGPLDPMSVRMAQLEQQQQQLKEQQQHHSMLNGPPPFSSSILIPQRQTASNDSSSSSDDSDTGAQNLPPHVKEQMQRMEQARPQNVAGQTDSSDPSPTAPTTVAKSPPKSGLLARLAQRQRKILKKLEPAPIVEPIIPKTREEASMTAPTVKEEEPTPSVAVSNSNRSKPPCMSTKMRYEEYTPPVTWLELAVAPKMPEVEEDMHKARPVIPSSISPDDILLGRGGLTNSNPGNIKFRELVAKYRMAYCTAPKGDKGALARYLCNFVRSKRGRFLKRDDDTEQIYYEVGDDKAVSKCGQALREGTANMIRRPINDGGDDGGSSG